MMLWKLMIAVGLIAWYCPVFLFRKHKYFNYFLANSILDPIHLILLHFFQLNSHFYYPIALFIEFAFFPQSDHMPKVIASVSIIIITLHPGVNLLLEMLICEIILFLMIYYICIEITLGIKLQQSTNIFLFPLLLYFVRNVILFYFHYANEMFLINHYFWILTLNVMFPLLITYYGPNRKVSFGTFSSSYKIQTPAKTVNKHRDYHEELTNMELKVLLEFSNGLKCNEIADKLFVSPKTIYFHCSNLKSKLNLKTTNQLIKYSFENNAQLKQRILDK
jgi:DNA-binding CsgD family transcriptional regulator